MANEWIATSQQLPKDGEVVHTKIDDEKGCRNEQLLKRQGNLWFFPDGSMYVYYRPTHWMPLSLQERKLRDPFCDVPEESHV